MLIGGAVLAVVVVAVASASRATGDVLSLVPPQSGPLGAVPPPLAQTRIPARAPPAPKAAVQNVAPPQAAPPKPPSPKPAPLRAPPPPLPAGGLDEALRALLREGRKIEAIKVYREQTGRSLKE